MTVPAAIHLLVVTDDSLLADYILAATTQHSHFSVDCVSTLAMARSRLTARPVDCLVLDWELAPERVELFYRSVRSERSSLPVVGVADRPQGELRVSATCHAFVQKGAPSMGVSIVNAVGVLTASPGVDRDTAWPTAE